MSVGPWTWARQTYRAVCASIGITSMVVAGTGAYLVAQSGKATAVELDSVLDDFRSSAEPTASAPVDTSTTVAPATTDTTVAAAAAPTTTIPTGTSAPADTSAPPTTVAPPPTAAPTGPSPFVRPAEGVYTFAVTGSEKISVAGANHKYPSEIYGVLTYTQCGYQLVLHILEEHVDTMQFCLANTQLSMVKIHQKISFLGQAQAGAIECNPAALFVDRGAPTAGRTVDCQAGSIKADGPVAQRGETALKVGGATVKGMVTEWRWRAKGANAGGGTMTWTFGPDGVPLRLERSASTESDTVLGRVTHQETATFVLKSLTPRR